MTSLMIEQFTCRQDNFGVILHDPLTGETASIDAPDGSRIAGRLGQDGWKLTHLFITHHHPDHVEGIPALAKAYSPKVIGPEAEATKIAGLTQTVRDGDTFDFVKQNRAGDLHTGPYPGACLLLHCRRATAVCRRYAVRPWMWLSCLKALLKTCSAR